MSQNNILHDKINAIIESPSQIESNFPNNFKHMSNIEIKIKKNYFLEINIQYDDKFDDIQELNFKIRTIDDNKNIILDPINLIGSSHIELMENNGPFIIKR